MSHVRLSNIPESVQRMYKTGDSVECEVDRSVGGGNFSFKNNDGEMVCVDAVELSGTGILVTDLD